MQSNLCKNSYSHIYIECICTWSIFFTLYYYYYRIYWTTGAAIILFSLVSIAFRNPKPIKKDLLIVVSFPLFHIILQSA